MQTAISLSSPSWNKASYVDPTIRKVSIDTTLNILGKNTKYVL